MVLPSRYGQFIRHRGDTCARWDRGLLWNYYRINPPNRGFWRTHGKEIVSGNEGGKISLELERGHPASNLGFA